MDTAIIAAIIAAVVATVTGLIDMFLTIHRNRQDSITTYRMNWVNELREEYSKILSWDLKTQDDSGNTIFNPINDLQKSVYKVSLMLNTKDDYDKKLLDYTFKYLESIENIYNAYYMHKRLVKYKNEADSKEKQEVFERSIKLFDEDSVEAMDNIFEIKSELHKMIRIYLKVEWTRVKSETSILKFGYRKYYKRFKFNSEKALEDISGTYKEIDDLLLKKDI